MRDVASDHVRRRFNLARYDASHEIANGAPTDVDEDVKRIAAIEPNLVFPARIGLARIENGSLTALPADEGADLARPGRRDWRRLWRIRSGQSADLRNGQ